MTFDGELLASYRALLQHTDLQKAYQEFVRLFRYLRVQLEKQLPGYTFQGGIVENAMDYAYFQFTDPRLRAAGLKIVIVFVHRDFQLEVWLSGVNRKAQCAWAEKLGAGAPPFLPSQDPARTDYILRAPVAAELSQGPAVLAALLDQLQQPRASLKAYL